MERTNPIPAAQSPASPRSRPPALRVDHIHPVFRDQPDRHRAEAGRQFGLSEKAPLIGARGLDVATVRVFDPEGRWLGNVDSPLGVWIDEEMILALRSDPDTDVQRIEGYRLRRRIPSVQIYRPSSECDPRRTRRRMSAPDFW